MTVGGGRRRSVLAAGLSVVVLLAACSSSSKPATKVQAPSTCPAGPPVTPAGPPATLFAHAPIPAKVASETSPITVKGAHLVAFDGSGTDPSACATAPAVTGTAFSGRQVTIGTRGRPYLVMFVAHWCPHCRREVPLLAPWLRQGGVPKGIDVFLVATNTNASYPNYPPSSWLRGVNWPTEVIGDSPAGAAADAYGLTSFPYFVLVDAHGRVVSRFAGEVTTTALAQALHKLA